MKKTLLTIIALFSVCIPYVYADWSGIIHYNSNKKIINRQLQTGQYFNALKRDVVLSSLIASSTVLSGSSSGNQTINDVVYDVFTGSTVRQLCTSIAAYATDGNFSTFPVTYGSQNESVATVDSTGAISYVGDGTTYFTARYKNLTRAFPCTFLTSVGGTSYTFDSLLSTSLAQHLINTINTKISGLSPSATTQGLYSTRSAGTLTWVRNPDHFASTTDLTSAAVYNSSTGYTLTGALVAPDIMIHANHAHPSPGSITYFVTSTSTVVSSVISSGTNIAGTDIWVSKLATPITYGVTPAKVIAKNSIGIYGSAVTGTKLTATALGYMPVPVVFIPQDSTVYIGTTNLFTSTLESVTTPYRACNSTDYTGTYGGWYRLIVGGDSATPAYFIINNEAVLLGTWNMPCAPSNVSNYVTEINAAMTSLGSAYQLTTVDLSGFPTY